MYFYRRFFPASYCGTEVWINVNWRQEKKHCGSCYRRWRSLLRENSDGKQTGITQGEIIDNLINIRVIVRHRAPIINAQLCGSIDATRAICDTCRSINNTVPGAIDTSLIHRKCGFAGPLRLHLEKSKDSINRWAIISLHSKKIEICTLIGFSNVTRSGVLLNIFRIMLQVE